jgi:hypothetical protein
MHYFEIATNRRRISYLSRNETRVVEPIRHNCVVDFARVPLVGILLENFVQEAQRAARCGDRVLHHDTGRQ